MNRILFAVKLYLKTLARYNWGEFGWSWVNTAMILAVGVAIIREHGSVGDAAEVSAVAWPLLVIIFIIPFVATAAGLVIKYGLLKWGYELPDELWPEVEI